MYKIFILTNNGLEEPVVKQHYGFGRTILKDKQGNELVEHVFNSNGYNSIKGAQGDVELKGKKNVEYFILYTHEVA